MTDIEKLAKQVGVSVADVRCMAQLVANSMKEDKVIDIALGMNEKTQVELVEAYIPSAVRKIDLITTATITRPEVKTALMEQVYTDLVK